MSNPQIAPVTNCPAPRRSRRLPFGRAFLSVFPLPLVMSGLLSSTRGHTIDDYVGRKSDRAIRQVITQHTDSGWAAVTLILRTDLSPDREMRLKGLSADICSRNPSSHQIVVRIPNQRLTELARLAFVDHLIAGTLPVRTVARVKTGPSVKHVGVNQSSRRLAKAVHGKPA